jgi:hypothetical protein
VATILDGCIPSTLIVSGVDSPIQTASSQYVRKLSSLLRKLLFGSFLLIRLYLVRPPVPHSIGRCFVMLRRLRTGVACNCWYIFHRVAFTAAASFNGFRACSWTKGWKNSSAVWLPFFKLHFLHARVKLLIRLLPPRVFGIICSTSKSLIFSFPQ